MTATSHHAAKVFMTPSSHHTMRPSLAACAFSSYNSGPFPGSKFKLIFIFDQFPGKALASIKLSVARLLTSLCFLG